jgi:hypothetical protein
VGVLAAVNASLAGKSAVLHCLACLCVLHCDYCAQGKGLLLLLLRFMVALSIMRPHSHY